MNSWPDLFFGKASSIRLTEAEKDSVKEKLKMYVRNDKYVRLEGHMNQKNFFQVAQGLRLDTAEKARVREALFAEMGRLAHHGRPFVSLFKIFSGCMAAVMVFVLCGASISYAAESALPGDALYTIKVNLTEPLLLRFNSSTEAKVRVQARLATRRLEEAQNLAERSDLTVEKIAIVNKRLAEHIVALEADLKELEGLNKDRSATIALDTSTEIQARENVLLRIVSEEERSRVENLLTTTRNARKITDKATMSGHADTVRLTKDAAKKAEQAILKAKAVYSVQKNAVVADTIRNAEDDLNASSDLEASARVNIEKATSALRQAKEANLMLRLKGGAFITTDPTKIIEDPVVIRVVSDPTEASSETASETSVDSSASSSVKTSSSVQTSSSASSQPSSAGSSSSTTSSATTSSRATSSAISLSASASISVSTSSENSSVGEVLKKTDDLIKKTLPKL